MASFTTQSVETSVHPSLFTAGEGVAIVLIKSSFVFRRILDGDAVITDPSGCLILSRASLQVGHALHGPHAWACCDHPNSTPRLHASLPQTQFKLPKDQQTAVLRLRKDAPAFVNALFVQELAERLKIVPRVFEPALMDSNCPRAGYSASRLHDSSQPGDVTQFDAAGRPVLPEGSVPSMDGFFLALRCAAFSHGCESGFRLGVRLHDLLQPREAEGETWIPAYIQRGRVDLTETTKPGFYKAGHEESDLFM